MAALVAQGKKSEGDFNMNQPEFVDIPAKTYMSEQEFIAHMDELIPTPSVETNSNLLDLANSLWWEMKDDLYHAFSFVSRHFTPETLQSCAGPGERACCPGRSSARQFTRRRVRRPKRSARTRCGPLFFFPSRRPLARSAPWPPAQCGKTGRKPCFIPFTSGKSTLKSCWIRRWRGPVSPVQR